MCKFIFLQNPVGNSEPYQYILYPGMLLLEWAPLCTWHSNFLNHHFTEYLGDGKIDSLLQV